MRCALLCPLFFNLSACQDVLARAASLRTRELSVLGHLRDDDSSSASILRASSSTGVLPHLQRTASTASTASVPAAIASPSSPKAAQQPPSPTQAAGKSSPVQGSAAEGAASPPPAAAAAAPARPAAALEDEEVKELPLGAPTLAYLETAAALESELKAFNNEKAVGAACFSVA